MKKYIFSGIAMCCLFLMSCSKDDVKIDPIVKLELYKIGEQIQGSTRVIVWGDKSIETGYEKVYLQFLDKSNSSLTDGQVTLSSVMEMNMNGEVMSHSSPADPVKSGNDGLDGLFEGGVVVTMASNEESGKWKLLISYTSLNKDVINFAVPVNVKANTESNVKTITTKNGNRYVLSFYLSETPKIGVNEANLTLHRQESMMNFPSYQTAEIIIDPRMPDMDNHGSPNNVNPVHKADGHYVGKLNYTMSGLWRVNLELTIEGEKITTSFDQTF